ncbi:hypothetical protein SPKIRA_22630 [Sphingomonas paucimobilis]|nr:hypothetical protein SPKIRA_22630 [Sphingomonas paucimobilis]
MIGYLRTAAALESIYLDARAAEQSQQVGQIAGHFRKHGPQTNYRTAKASNAEGPDGLGSNHIF